MEHKLLSELNLRIRELENRVSEQDTKISQLEGLFLHTQDNVADLLEQHVKNCPGSAVVQLAVLERDHSTVH